MKKYNESEDKSQDAENLLINSFCHLYLGWTKKRKAIFWKFHFYCLNFIPCEVGIKRLSRDTSCSERTIKRVIKDLVEIGALQRKKKLYKNSQSCLHSELMYRNLKTRISDFMKSHAHKEFQSINGPTRGPIYGPTELKSKHVNDDYRNEEIEPSIVRKVDKKSLRAPLAGASHEKISRTKNLFLHHHLEFLVEGSSGEKELRHLSRYSPKALDYALKALEDFILSQPGCGIKNAFSFIQSKINAYLVDGGPSKIKGKVIHDTLLAEFLPTANDRRTFNRYTEKEIIIGLSEVRGAQGIRNRAAYLHTIIKEKKSKHVS